MIDNADLLADYLGEARDYLERFDRQLLAFEAGDSPTPEQINDLFRAAHSLKGLSASFGFERTNALTHRLENLLARVQRGEQALDSSTLRAMFDAVDLLEALTGEVGAGSAEGASIQIVCDRLDALCALKIADPVAAKTAESVNDLKTPAKAAAGAAAAGGKRSEETETVRVKMERLDRLINMTGELVIARSRFALATRAMQSLPNPRDASGAVTELQVGLQALQGHADPAVQQAVSALLSTTGRVQQTFTDLQALPRVGKDLELATYDLEGIVNGLHEAVLEIRMVPIDMMFRRLQRTVRDTAELVGKTVQVTMSGGDTLLDKKVADELVNPLVHLLRNAIDHGLEPTADRAVAKKPPAGRIRITAQQRGSSVVVEIADDGRGIDPERMRRKAVESGVVTAEEAATMSPEDLQRLIFRPGFSTAAKVTEVSGRGMGMDIVESTLKRLRGQLDMRSIVGQGTTFSIQLPPSVSILACLLLRVRGTIFAAPLAEVQEIVPQPLTGPTTVQGRPVLMVRERPIPLIELPEVYRFTAPAQPATEEQRYAVVLQGARQACAIAVDSLVGKEDLVMKPLCAELQNVPGLAGMAVRGDGCVSLILDTATFSERAASIGR